MKHLITKSVLFSCVVINIVAALSGQAQTGRHIDKTRAAEIAQAQFGGELFGKIKETTANDGTKLFEVRLDTKGHVDIILVDDKGNARQKN